MRRSIRWLRKAAANGVPIEPGERALISAPELGGGVVVATDRALYHPCGPGSFSRLGWETICDVGWHDRLLTVVPVPPADPVHLRLTGGTSLPDFAREQVRSTILVTSQVPLDGRICARLTARRAPGSDRITWVVALRNAAESTDPAVRARVAAVIAELGGELGLVHPRPVELWSGPAHEHDGAPGEHAAMLRAVLFDLDDTLVDQRTAARTALVSWAAEHGITGPDVIERWKRISDIHYARYQRRELTFTQQRRERVREFLTVDVDDERADEIFAGYLKRYEAAWTRFDDAVPALRRARSAGLTVAVLTNGDEDHQRSKLTQLGLSDEVDILIASSTLPAGKPDPRAFRQAVERVDVDANEALMVGDSIDRDVRGALSAGMKAVLLDRDNEHRDTDVPRVRSLDDLTFAGERIYARAPDNAQFADGQRGR